MESTARLNPDLGNMTLAAYLIEKVHRCADCPIRQQAIKDGMWTLRRAGIERMKEGVTTLEEIASATTDD